MAILYAFLLMMAGSASAFAGLCFMNGKLMPSILAKVYLVLPVYGWRLGLSVCTFSVFTSFVFSKGFALAGQSIGGTTYVVSLITCMVIYAVLVDGLRLNWHIIGGTSVLLLGACWVVYGMNLGR